ncbi:hypothetical protein CW701_00840 [Candidatus Bathyarchaeota archaeon]|nr:MAG: hypothetical protein CW701_00840 [Candidatus Bathyarchaeota archaeon]RLI19590.1 MAG: hypothetical protein DRO49_00160 [Candidatus Bathyarchaeota archaeon]
MDELSHLEHRLSRSPIWSSNIRHREWLADAEDRMLSDLIRSIFRSSIEEDGIMSEAIITGLRRQIALNNA